MLNGAGQCPIQSKCRIIRQNGKKASISGRKLNGYTAQELRNYADKYQKLAK